MFLTGMSITSVQAAPPSEALTLFDFLGTTVEADDGWVDPLDFLDEPVTEGLEQEVDDDASLVEAAGNEKPAPEPATETAVKEEMQR